LRIHPSSFILHPSHLPVGLCAQLACIWEATARKPGNVHRYRDFEDAAYVDFLASAAAIAPVLEAAAGRPVGMTILEAVRATRRVVATNTNLGIVLLLAPLAAVPRTLRLEDGLAGVLDALDLADARAVYEAIRLAAPAGLGRVPEQDIAGEPTETLRQVMVRAADRDLVARQYANGFRQVFAEGVPAFRESLLRTESLEGAIIGCQLALLALHPDSLIARKHGPAEAEEASRRAHRVLEAGWPGEPAGRAALADLDAWLGTPGHGRNPGTTADLVAACLFALLREGTIQLPPAVPWRLGPGHE
jgi:triphosphoribosyl-dephospho-CoA synthase